MDYNKMCFAAKKYLDERWNPKERDLVAHISFPDSTEMIGIDYYLHVVEDGKERFIFIPTQRQLYDLLKEHMKKENDCDVFGDLMDFIDLHNYEWMSRDMECLLLEFLFYIKYCRTWDGNEWKLKC